MHRNPATLITKILQQFNDQIQKSNISTNIENNIWTSGPKAFKLSTDWNIYNLILFNVIQNAVKYNNKNGSIHFGLDLKFDEENNKIEMQTIIRDTGIGIEPERLKFMFKTFEELIENGQLSRVKDHGIGLGLANSKMFAAKLGGKIKIVKSDQSGTQITLSIPVETKARSYSNYFGESQNAEQPRPL